MQIKSYLQPLCRAVALGCMLYALTLVADTARASVLPVPATGTTCPSALPVPATDIPRTLV
jgi:hypothetical protein